MNQDASYLFVPTVDHMLEKAFRYSADALIFDLEDSIRVEDKDHALDRLIIHLADRDSATETRVYVRVNADRVQYEIEKLKQIEERIDGIVLPKVEQVASLAELDFSGEILALIETPKGMINLPEIAREQSVSTILFGAEDYTSETGMKNDERLITPLKIDIVKYAKANNKRCIDTVCKEYKDETKVRESIKLSKDLGFDGKLLIHPMQVAITNEIYSVENIDKKRRILDAFKECTSGVLLFEGELYESPHIEMIRREIDYYDKKRNGKIL